MRNTLKAGLLGILVALSALGTANASQVGWRKVTVPSGTLEPAPIVVALYYPTSAPARLINMGPFDVTAAVQSEPNVSIKGLLVLSHGTGGTELGHSSLAQSLAQQGYLVAALRHPGDNWLDTTLRDGPGALRYFVQRPRQITQVIDALVQDPLWKDRLASDSHGLRIGVIGHSAGGYTALAMVGGQPDTSRLIEHCKKNGSDDPIFCGATRNISTESRATPEIPIEVDSRVRAVVALAPLGAVFSQNSLSSIHVPTLIYEAGNDRYLVPRFHSRWISSNIPRAEIRNIPGAVHFAFMDTPRFPILTPDGDIGTDTPGFDRKAFLESLGDALPIFFEKAWNE